MLKGLFSVTFAGNLLQFDRFHICRHSGPLKLARAAVTVPLQINVVCWQVVTSISHNLLSLIAYTFILITFPLPYQNIHIGITLGGLSICWQSVQSTRHINHKTYKLFLLTYHRKNLFNTRLIGTGSNSYKYTSPPTYMGCKTYNNQYVFFDELYTFQKIYSSHGHTHLHCFLSKQDIYMSCL